MLRILLAERLVTHSNRAGATSLHSLVHSLTSSSISFIALAYLPSLFFIGSVHFPQALLRLICSYDTLNDLEYGILFINV